MGCGLMTSGETKKRRVRGKKIEEWSSSNSTREYDSQEMDLRVRARGSPDICRMNVWDGAKVIIPSFELRIGS